MAEMMTVTPAATPILIGLNYRDFPGNWRPAHQEIAFARAHDFGSIQFHGRETGLSDSDLGFRYSVCIVTRIFTIIACTYRYSTTQNAWPVR